MRKPCVDQLDIVAQIADIALFLSSLAPWLG
jgi:hypothetical protein